MALFCGKYSHLVSHDGFGLSVILASELVKYALAN